MELSSLPSRATSSSRRISFTVLAVLALAGCASESATAPTLAPESQFGLASVQLNANVAGTPISTLLITVTGDGIPVALIYNLTVTNNQAAGTLKIPAGSARSFVVKAFDTNGDITHDGALTTDVARGQNDPLKISLVPRNGQQPVQIFMGDFMVVVSPATKTIRKGETFQLAAVVTAPNGDRPTPTVSWATADPSIATVDPTTGMVVGKRGGAVQIMATYGGVGGIMNLGVLDADAPLNIVGPAYPPPGNVTFDGGTGNTGTGTGRLLTYTNLDLTQSRFLAYGASDTDMPVVVFNVTTGTTTVPSGTTRMSIDGANSNPAGGIVVYTGTTAIPLAGGGSKAVNTRLTITMTTVSGGVVAPAVLSGAPSSFPNIGGYAQIPTTFTRSDVLRANVLFEASADGGPYTPALTFFNSYPLKAANAASVISYTGAFYYSY